MKFNNKTEKYVYVFFLMFLIGSLTIISINIFNTKQIMTQKNQKVSVSVFAGPAKTADEYYEMFKCPCCGKNIDTDCCGMAKQRKEYIDSAVLGDITNMDVLIGYGKKFGMDDFDEATKQQIQDYMREVAGKNPPTIIIDKERINLGTIKQSEGKVYAEFKITNSGKSDLIIDNMETSCMCTSASIVYEGNKGPWFGMSMHGENPTDYSVSIKPGETATLNVEYDPNAHGPQKDPSPQKIIREITVMSNDPENFQTKIKIELVQVP